MNVVCPIFLFYAYGAIVTLAFLNYRSPTSLSSRRLPFVTPRSGGPLLLSPLIDAGDLQQARNQSRVVPFLDDIESYTGFLTVNRTTKSHLFFWFIPKTTSTDNKSSPVILWLQGGPGCSSLTGLFAENGPFQITRKGLEKRVHAWTNNYHMLYIDQPVGTGFSFTEGDAYISTEEEVGDHLYTALVQFYQLFPEFRDRDFYISGESYAGKYIPAIGRKIHASNGQSHAVHHIPLKGMMIGNGFSDPENMLEHAVLLHSIGLIDKNERQQLETIQDRTRYLIRSGNWSLATSSFMTLLDGIQNFIDSINMYDYTSDDSIDKSYIDYVMRDQIRRRMHVGRIEFESCSGHVRRQLHHDLMQSVRPWIEELLEFYPILFYNGQFDIVCAHSLTENYIEKLHWSGAMEYGVAEKKVWRVDGEVAGFYKSAANLVYVMVRNAGHMVPTSQPMNALNLIDMCVKKKFYDNSTRRRE